MTSNTGCLGRKILKRFITKWHVWMTKSSLSFQSPKEYDEDEKEEQNHLNSFHHETTTENAIKLDSFCVS